MKQAYNAVPNGIAVLEKQLLAHEYLSDVASAESGEIIVDEDKLIVVTQTGARMMVAVWNGVAWSASKNGP